MGFECGANIMLLYTKVDLLVLFVVVVSSDVASLSLDAGLLS